MTDTYVSIIMIADFIITWGVIILLSSLICDEIYLFVWIKALYARKHHKML